ncbi:MAG: DUF4203 domain-containing protein [Acidobacteria bacterium]|nr:DUF4203 domain-containing protein [Acidobacteriota bacterium]
MMLPHSYEVPAAMLLVAGGALSCFAGYRLFRLVLGIYGFVIGAMLASSIVAPTSTAGMAAAAIAGGLLGAATLILACFVGVAIVGAGLGALVAHLSWQFARTSAEPPVVLVVLLAVAGAVAALFLQRYVIIVATAFAGAWMFLVGVFEIAAARPGPKPSPAPVWILYPLNPGSGERWIPIVWAALGLAGVAVQLATSMGKKK